MAERIATLRIPCVHGYNWDATMKAVSKRAVFSERTDVRSEENKQKPGHWIIYIDIYAFKCTEFEAEFRALEGRECLKVMLDKYYKGTQIYVLIGIGKSQEECDAEVADKAEPVKAEPFNPQDAAEELRINQ
jgi:hypothetical protein